jgi:hypothetical protein
MSLLVDESQIDDELAEQLSRKLPLEWTLLQQINKFFKEIARDEAMNFRVFGSAVSLDKYRARLEDILYDHYIKVARLASKDFLDTLKDSVKIGANIKNEYDDELSQKIAIFAATAAAKKASIITQTNQKDFEKAVADAAATEAAARIASQELSNELGEDIDLGINFDDEFEEEFIDELSSRAGTIAKTETHDAFEFGKYAAALSIIIAANLEDDDMVKVWVATMDGKEREAHLEAHLQKRKVDEPFRVGDSKNGYELLDYAGDSNGSAWNVANCGCITVYILNGEIISTEGGERYRGASPEDALLVL